MISSRLGLLSLCATALGVMAFGATAVHAEAGSNWLILMSNGEVLTGSQLNASIGAETDKTAILLTQILKLKVETSCSAFEVRGAELIGEGTISQGRLVLSGCITKINGVANVNCTPHSAGEPAGTVATNNVTGLIKGGTILILPINEGMRFFTWEMPETCPVGEKVSFFGEISLKDCEEKFSTHLAKHLVEEYAPSTAMWAINETAEHRVTIDGGAWIFLTGAHAGLAFAG